MHLFERQGVTAMHINIKSGVAYTLFVAVISSLATILFYHVFIFNTFSATASHPPSLRQIEPESVISSPIKQENSIIEVMSYGCHFCEKMEEDIAEFARELPPGTIKVIHITAEGNGLAASAPLFATLQEMGIENKMRSQAYSAIINRNINLADDNALKSWLKENEIDVDEYHRARKSQAVAQRLEYMASVTRHYEINATPLFIVNKKFVVAKDRPFAEFSRRMRQLLAQGNKE